MLSHEISLQCTCVRRLLKTIITFVAIYSDKFDRYAMPLRLFPVLCDLGRLQLAHYALKALNARTCIVRVMK